jgi:hypothetical protein
MVIKHKETKPIILNSFEFISHLHGPNLFGLFETPQVCHIDGRFSPPPFSFSWMTYVLYLKISHY